MRSAVTGRRGRGINTKVRCVDVAVLFVAAILHRNPDSAVASSAAESTLAASARNQPNLRSAHSVAGCWWATTRAGSLPDAKAPRP